MTDFTLDTVLFSDNFLVSAYHHNISFYLFS